MAQNLWGDRMLVARTPIAMSTTSLRPMSPRVASTTSGGRPKTVRTNHQRVSDEIERLLELTSLSDLGGTRILIIKSSDEEERFTSGVDLVVDGTLGEERSLTLGHGVENESSAVLFDETGFHCPVHNVQELGRSRVGVRAVHAAWAEKSIYFRNGWVRDGAQVHLRHLNHSHGQAVSEQSGEVGNVRDARRSTSARTRCNGKIEQPLGTDNVSMLDGRHKRYQRRCSLTSLLLLRILSRAT